MAAYATFQDVQARAGRFADIFTVAGKRPNQDDVEDLLDAAAAEIDAAIEARGIDAAALNTAARAALVDLNAYGALARALPAASTDAKALELADRARKYWGAAMGDPTSNTAAGQMGSILSGNHPVVRLIEAGLAGAAGSSAGSYWEDRPEPTEDPDLAPTFTRTQKT